MHMHTQVEMTKDHMAATKTYWMINNIWQGRSERKMPVGQAIKKINRARDQTTTNHPIFWRLTELLDDIIKNQAEPAVAVNE